MIGSQAPDLNATRVVWEGSRRGDRNVAPGAGIRREFRVTWKPSQVHEWDREALKGHTYTYTDNGPEKVWNLAGPSTRSYGNGWGRKEDSIIINVRS